MKELLLVAIALACPLMMVLMMRGHGHGGHGGHAHAGRDHHGLPDETSTEDLHRRRDELDRVIEERERSDRESSLTGRG